MGIKKNIKKLKEDAEKNAEDIATFYSNPKKYLSRVHPYLKVAFVAYVIGFLLIVKFVGSQGMEIVIFRLFYIGAGYLFLNYLYGKYQH